MFRHFLYDDRLGTCILRYNRALRRVVTSYIELWRAYCIFFGSLIVFVISPFGMHLIIFYLDGSRGGGT